jgi:hypothetical protein
MRASAIVLAGLVALGFALLRPLPVNAQACGSVETLETHGGTRTRYALAPVNPATPPRAVLVLLVGGNGHLDLDPGGCPRALAGNTLVRMLPQFHAAGFATALVDAPSDHLGEDGLGGFRAAPEHAADLGRLIAGLRPRLQAPVWAVGISRGSISAANAAARLTGSAAPDGVVLMSVVSAGDDRARKAWVAQTVFDLPLEAIAQPTLIVGHANDACLRSPAANMGRIAERLRTARKQVATVTGGQQAARGASLDACAGRTPHGFLEQEAEVLAGVARFVAGGSY